MRNRSLFKLALLAGLMLLSLVGCGKKEVVPLPVPELTDYRDPGYGFHISYPSTWMTNAEVGRALFFSTQDVDKRFLDPDGSYPDGAIIEITLVKTPNPATLTDSIISQMKSIGFQISPVQEITVAGKKAQRYPYTARYNSGSSEGEHVYIDADSILYDIWFAGFGDYYKSYKNVFEAALTSFQLPKPKLVGVDATLPSETYEKGDTKYFTYEYPDNFNFNSDVKKGTFEYSMELHGYREDCSIRFDVFDAKGQAIDKVFDQNKGKYRATGTGKETIGGEQAMYVSYAATRDVNSRAFFLVHNGKAFRITTNWYKPQEKEYSTAFSKILGSIKFK
ncbi:MAG: hypothetical protein WB699_06645 [Bacteroidota bacterium]